MTTVTKSVKFDAAHVLTDHQGLCGNLHGHAYRAEETPGWELVRDRTYGKTRLCIWPAARFGTNLWAFCYNMPR